MQQLWHLTHSVATRIKLVVGAVAVVLVLAACSVFASSTVLSTETPTQVDSWTG